MEEYNVLEEVLSKYSFSQESCMPKCCSKMHMKMRYDCQRQDQEREKGLNLCIKGT